MQQEDYSANPADFGAPSGQSNQQTPDLAGYKSFGTFAPIYTDARRYLYRELSLRDARPAHMVLIALAEHAGPLGTMFELSENRLMDVSALSRDKVKQGMAIMISLGWLKQHQTYMPTRRKSQVDWQLCPYVLYIAPHVISETFELWKNAHPIESAHIFAHTESRYRESRFSNQTQKPHDNHLQNTESVREGAGAHRVESRGRRRQTNVQKWDEVSIELCRTALQTPEDEYLAQTIASVVRTHVTQARQMIRSYGGDTVHSVYRTFTESQKTRPASNPGGAFVAALRREHGRPLEAGAAGGD